MDVCDICFDPPKPLETVATGTLRLDAWDGERRLLGEAAFREPVRLHYVAVDVKRRVWTSEGWTLCAVTVYNRSSLPLTRVLVSPGAAAFSGGLIRVNGVPAAEDGPVLSGLGPGCAAVLTWETRPADAPSERDLLPASAEYEYRFAGQPMAGTAWSK